MSGTYNKLQYNVKLALGNHSSLSGEELCENGDISNRNRAPAAHVEQRKHFNQQEQAFAFHSPLTGHLLS